MAWPNINERQSAVYKLCSKHGRLTSNIKKELAAKYNCSYGAIHADVVSYFKNGDAPTYPSKKLKAKVLQRDNYKCQYCGGCNNLVVDHVVPSILGGHGKEYNLVAACWSCNMKKRGGKVWMPINFDELKSINLAWAKQIKKLAEIDFRQMKK